MTSLFKEYENENALRSYPFAEGCSVEDTDGTAIGTGVIVDAILYPLNPAGTLYLSGISVDGTVSIADSKKTVMTGAATSGSPRIELYDTSDFHRHSGTLLCSSADAVSMLVTVGAERKFSSGHTAFASSCVFPVVNDGVTSLNIGETGVTDGLISITNGDNASIRVATTESGDRIRFDVIPDPSQEIPASIQHIYCIVDGNTPFRIEKPRIYASDNTVILYLDNIDRQSICNNAHREESLEMTDTCKDCTADSCHQDMEDPVEIPYVYQTEVVDIPNGADSAFYLSVENMTGYVNPLSITLTDGAVVPNTEVTVDTTEDDHTDELTDTITSKGVVLQLPGLSAS